jgi:hypothetical protein
MDIRCSLSHLSMAAHPAPEHAAALSDWQLHIARVAFTMLRAGGGHDAGEITPNPSWLVLNSVASLRCPSPPCAGGGHHAGDHAAGAGAGAGGAAHHPGRHAGLRPGAPPPAVRPRPPHRPHAGVGFGLLEGFSGHRKGQGQAVSGRTLRRACAVPCCLPADGQRLLV